MVVRISFNDRVVRDFGEAARDKASEGVVVGVEVRAEELGDEVWFLVRGRAEVFGGGVDAWGGEAVVFLVMRPAVVHVATARCGAAFFGREEGFLFGFQRFGEVSEEGFEGGVEGDVEEDDEDEEDDHEDDGARCGSDTEEPDEADDGEVGACGGLLQRSGVDETFGVDVGVEDEEQVVAIGEVDEVETDSREAKNQGCNDRVRDSCQGLLARGV